MDTLTNAPQWLATAVFGVLVATLSYVAKQGEEWWRANRAAHAARIASLQDLAALLRTARSLYLVQNERAQRLLAVLRSSHPGELPDEAGYERAFASLYDRFTPEERELHGIIRSITVSALRPVNQEVSAWLKADRTFRTASTRIAHRQELARQLHQLEVHLSLWHAKYEYWIPDEPRHALVYLADEEDHGIGFPTRIDQTIQDALEELRSGLGNGPAGRVADSPG